MVHVVVMPAGETSRHLSYEEDEDRKEVLSTPCSDYEYMDDLV